MRRPAHIRPLATAAATCLATAALVAAPASSAQAWVSEGCKMGTRNVTYQSSQPTAYATAVSASVTSWNNSTSVLTLSKVSSGGKIAVVVGGYGSTGWDGLTSYQCTIGYFDGQVLARINRTYTDSYSTNKRRSVITHELGHSIGLAHNNARACDVMAVMYYETQGRYDSCNVYTPRADDITGINALY